MSTNPLNIKVILPAYNEEGAIGKIIEDVHGKFLSAGYKNLEIIIVNDGSSDRTEKISKELSQKHPVTVLSHEKNRGLGAALRKGIYYAARASQPEDIILTTESDGTQPIETLIELANTIQKDHVDFAVASPRQSSDYLGVPFYRQFLSHSANSIYGLLFPITGIHSYTNLARGFRASILHKALELYGEDDFIDLTGFEAVPDIILKLRRLNPKAIEIRTVLDHQQMRRRSSIPIARTIKNSLLLCYRHFVKKFD